LSEPLADWQARGTSRDERYQLLLPPALSLNPWMGDFVWSLTRFS